MITPEQRELLFRYAYLPEHLPDYAHTVGGAEPFLDGDFLYYYDESSRVLIFIGYPLRNDCSPEQVKNALRRVVETRGAAQVALLCPDEIMSGGDFLKCERDGYYRLTLDRIVVRQKLRNTLGRAARELTIETGRELKREHRKLIKEFFKHRKTDGETAYIFGKIPEYVASVESAVVFSARTRKGKLAAFDVADFGSSDYGFYMFNFVSRKRYVPGASDLLLSTLADECRYRGKRYLNLGLGINPGIEFFKKKWGAERFREYYFFHYMVSEKS